MITLITPTGGRPKQIRLCAEWMRRQTYTGDVLWVIVDDCSPTTTEFIKGDFRENWTIVKVYPEPKWREGQNTQSRNLLAGVNVVKKYENISAIFIIEDDDYYSPEYLQEMVNKLDGHVAAAQTNTVYFNLQSFTLKRHTNTKHGSLFQTGFTFDVLPVFENATKRNVQFIDIQFWKLLKNKPVNLFTVQNNLAVGIKAMQGRKGIGNGHITRSVNTNKVQGFLSLKKLIGKDYLHYI
jgi:glycosyltransferase involved in cell wall biosynthesis